MINSGELPPECEAGMSTVEYCFDDVSAIDNTFIFVIDCAVRPSEVAAIKECLKDTFSKMGPNVSIAIITFTRYIQVYELNYT
jgi:protein transport protein SEC23